MSGIVSVVGPEAYFQGTLNAKGSIRIDGKLDGSVMEAQAVVIGESGKISGDISCETVVVGGEVKGDICAAAGVELLSTAKVTGDITTARIMIEEGAYFDGNCNMSKAAAQPKDEPAELTEEKEEI